MEVDNEIEYRKLKFPAMKRITGSSVIELKTDDFMYKIARFDYNQNLKDIYRRSIKGVSDFVDLEIGFNEYDKKPDNRIVYIAAKADDVIGYLELEPINQAYRMLDDISIIDKNATKAVAGVVKIWTRNGYRRKGVGTRLLDTCRLNAFSTFVIPKHELAFSALTEDAFYLAYYYIGNRDDILIYFYSDSWYKFKIPANVWNLHSPSTSSSVNISLHSSHESPVPSESPTPSEPATESPVPIYTNGMQSFALQTTPRRTIDVPFGTHLRFPDDDGEQAPLLSPSLTSFSSPSSENDTSPFPPPLSPIVNIVQYGEYSP